MYKMKMRVPADRVGAMKKEHEEMGMGNMMEVIPVDLYGKRTMLQNTSAEESQKEIREFYGLE